MSSVTRQRSLWAIGNTIVIIVAIVPVLWIASLSFKDPSTITDATFFPRKWTLQNYREIFDTSLFTRALGNSIGIALIATFLAVVVGSMAAYAIARLRFPGKGVLIGATLLIAVFPAISLVSPLFNLWRQLGLFDTWPGLIIPYLTFSLPLDRKPANLSGGQRQRVAMGRAIVRSPQAFLMDEPLSNLDAKLRVQMRTTVSRLQNQLGTTTVYVTHDQIEAMTLGDRVAVMRAGVIQQVGTPQELYEQPRNLFVAGFIGSPAMNFLPATPEDGQLRTPIGDIALPAEVRAKAERAGAGRTVIVGIRPEHFNDAALVGDKKAEGLTFSALVDVLEWLGSDMYAYFHIQGARATARELEELAADAGASDVPGGGEQIVARLDTGSRAREGEKLELWWDIRRVHLFNPDNGAHLTL